MIRFLARALILLASSAMGLLAAGLLLPAMEVTGLGVVLTVIFFTVLQSIISPLLTKVFTTNAPAFLGGVGVISTFVSLLLATLFGGGLVINGWRTWVLATLVVWLVTAIATVALPPLVRRLRGTTKAEA